MPKYVYSCSACSSEFEVNHGMMETFDCCTLCEATGQLSRIPQLTNVVRKDTTGSQVIEAIEENKKILKEMKKNIKRSYDE
tara:strand:- start:298 stop:540 length:243 start_codon:yes stop_codon:yes gene_type:complete